MNEKLSNSEVGEKYLSTNSTNYSQCGMAFTIF